MWHGLRVLSSARTSSSHSPSTPPTTPAASTGTHDRQLVRLLANMVLATQSEVHYAY